MTREGKLSSDRKIRIGAAFHEVDRSGTDPTVFMDMLKAHPELVIEQGGVRYVDEDFVRSICIHGTYYPMATARDAPSTDGNVRQAIREGVASTRMRTMDGWVVLHVKQEDLDAWLQQKATVQGGPRRRKFQDHTVAELCKLGYTVTVSRNGMKSQGKGFTQGSVGV